MKFSIKDFFSKWDQIRRKLDLVTFTEEILNGKLHFLCNENMSFKKTGLRWTDSMSWDQLTSFSSDCAGYAKKLENRLGGSCFIKTTIIKQVHEILKAAFEFVAVQMT